MEEDIKPTDDVQCLKAELDTFGLQRGNSPTNTFLSTVSVATCLKKLPENYWQGFHQWSLEAFIQWTSGAGSYVSPTSVELKAVKAACKKFVKNLDCTFSLEAFEYAAPDPSTIGGKRSRQQAAPDRLITFLQAATNTVVKASRTRLLYRFVVEFLAMHVLHWFEREVVCVAGVVP